MLNGFYWFMIISEMYHLEVLYLKLNISIYVVMKYFNEKYNKTSIEFKNNFNGLSKRFIIKLIFFLIKNLIDMFKIILYYYLLINTL